MFERRSDGKAQVGIGTLVVFIAMVLVAAIAAGVLINTAGFLQTKSSQTGQDSSDQVTDRIDIAPKSGAVGMVDGKEVIGRVNVTVHANPGAGNVDLRNVTVQWLDPSGVYHVTHYRVDAGDADFAATALKDADDSLPVLNDPDDRFILTFDTGGDPTNVTMATSDGTVNVDETDEPLGEGSTVRIKLSTKSGATTQTTVTVPETLSGYEAVQL
ncbi:archaellin/type IV pilin N-terminal domain-containing protein [Halosimplex amylolyticum]|uniref:archaellin/type IV pilin N-terminal domain-containing protein n=1 Tax=Halosimplex amylolyticum TaxID=3396616 RepID=UPI003F552048